MGLPRVVVENAGIEDSTDDGDGAGDVLVLTVRARKVAARRCGKCRWRAPWYDNGGGVRCWRHHDRIAAREAAASAALDQLRQQQAELAVRRGRDTAVVILTRTV